MIQDSFLEVPDFTKPLVSPLQRTREVIECHRPTGVAGRTDLKGLTVVREGIFQINDVVQPDISTLQRVGDVVE